jgi:hypothetical protein
VELTGLCYQIDPNWPVPLAQAHIVDTLTQFGNTDSGFGHPFDFVTMENLAALQFSHDHPDEDDGDLFGYLLRCTQGAVPVMGGAMAFARRMDR